MTDRQRSQTARALELSGASVEERIKQADEEAVELERAVRGWGISSEDRRSYVRLAAEARNRAAMLRRGQDD